MRCLTIAITVAALILATGAVASPREVVAGTPFTDTAGSPFAGDINWAYDNEITGGCTATRFCPKSVVTRDQMASFLDRMFNLPTTSTDFFTDDAGNIHQAAINRVAAAGITGGCATGKYCPRATVTREQMASFIARAAKLPNAGNNPFYDDDFRSHEGNINRIAAAGIGSGCGTYRYCPAATVTREQMVAFLHRVVNPVNPPPAQAPCDRSYSPALCIPSPPPDLNCDDVSYRDFRVRPPDPHNFDGDADGIGCET